MKNDKKFSFNDFTETLLLILIIGLCVSLLAGTMYIVYSGINEMRNKDAYNYAYVSFPNGDQKEIKIKSYKRIDNQIEIETPDGQIYLVDSTNIVLTKEPK